jgi:hypothetical protein
VIALLLAAATPAPLRVAAVTVTAVGQADPANAGTDPPGRCRPFRPTAREVLAWFRAARRVPVAATVEADRSQCLARGVLTAGDGRRYRWELDQAGLAAVTLSPTASAYFLGRALPFRVGL